MVALWCVRVTPWLVTAYGVVLVGIAGLVYVESAGGAPVINPVIPAVAGVGLAAVGIYVEWRARGSIRRQRELARPRGFEVLPVAPTGRT